MSDWYWIVLIVASMVIDWRWRKILKLRSYDEGYSHGLIDGELRGKLAYDKDTGQ